MFYPNLSKEEAVGKVRKEAQASTSYAYDRGNGTWTAHINEICYASIKSRIFRDQEIFSFPTTIACIGDKGRKFFCESHRSAYKRFQENRKGVYKYIDWVLNRSPWHPIFTTKDARSVIEGGCFSKLIYPHYYLFVGGLIALRMCDETQYVFPKHWNLLLSLGFSEKESFVLAHCVMESDEGLKGRVNGANHAVINYLTPAVSIKRFLTEDKVVGEEKPIQDKTLPSLFPWKNNCSNLTIALHPWQDASSFFGAKIAKPPHLSTDEKIVKYCNNILKVILEVEDK